MDNDAIDGIEEEISSGTKYNFWDYYKEIPYDQYDHSINETITIPTNDPKMAFVNVRDITLYKLPSLEQMKFEGLNLSLSSNKAHIYSDDGVYFFYVSVYLCIWY